MKISYIRIENYKSIESLEFSVKKYAASYTTMFVGINESGKSNVLEAMTLLKPVQGKEYNFLDICNQKKQEEVNSVDIYFGLEFESKNTYVNTIAKKVSKGANLLDFSLDNVCTRVYLQRNTSSFSKEVTFDISGLPKNLFIKKDPTSGAIEIANSNDETDSFQELSTDSLRSFFESDISMLVKMYEPDVTYWKAAEEYLISKANLREFVGNTGANKALSNIFLLAGYTSQTAIEEAIEAIDNPSRRSRLESKLNDELNNYIKRIWKHDIEVVIQITETGQFSLLLKDKGSENRHDRHQINNRSEGARHFLSLILSLSIESNKGKRRHQLILIDEPEVHLHPSGIRDLKNELLKIGEENFVFVSTHSPFLIDKKQKSRNIILKKNKRATTQKRELGEHEDIIDDEVLQEAFGLEVYKDLLNPHSMLVEGASDKLILQKAFTAKGVSNYGITNGHGSNIETLAAKLNDSDISILVLTDDDEQGRRYKERIVSLQGSYSVENVFTLRDMVGTMVASGTIEDLLGKEFVESQFRASYKAFFNREECGLVLEDGAPYIEQCKTFLQRSNECSQELVERIKRDLATTLNISSSSVLAINFPLLDALVVAVRSKIESTQ